MVKPPPFHTRPLRPTARQAHRRKARWRWLATLGGLLLAIAAAMLVTRLPETGGSWERIETRFSLCSDRSSHACVVDGDTIIFGNGAAARKIRLTGFNAPELAGECPAESALAIQSRDALLVWLNAGAFALDGAEEPPRDQYGRELRAAKRGEEWLAETMIARGLAQESGWGFTRGGWCG